jgi:hypothetical protein
VRAAGVVDARGCAGQGLELGQGGGLGGLGAEPVLHGLLEPLDLALGLGVARLAVLLPDAEAPKLVFQGVAAAPATGRAGGEDHAVEFLSGVKQFGGAGS